MTATGHSRWPWWLVLAGAFGSAPVQAQTAPRDPPAARPTGPTASDTAQSTMQTSPTNQKRLPAPDQRRPASFLQTGADLANKGAGKVAACASCHGSAGEGNAAAGFPRLASQSADYLWAQLNGYAEGRRPHPVMTPIATALTVAQREAVARHYASLRTGSRAAGAATAATTASTGAVPADRGRLLATVGDPARQLQACASCHGADGIGAAGGVPYLAGQPQAYLVAALRSWQDGSRRTDPSLQMPAIAKALSVQDVSAVAGYFAALPPVATPVDARAAGPARPDAAATRGPRP